MLQEVMVFALGYAALFNATGSRNVALGQGALQSNTTGGCNIGIGQGAGDNITTGDGNVIIGSTIDAPSATGDRQLVIAGYDGTTTTTWISGDSSGNVTIGGALTGTTIDASNNTISNVGNSQLISGIDAAKISSGSVSNTEFDYLDGVTSSIQTQMDIRATKGFAVAMAIAL